MSNYNSLKATIDANIKQNGNQEITGQILNSVLNEMVNILGTGYHFAGVATIDTNPGTPDAKVFYIANGKGTYTNFGGLEVTEDEVVILYWDTAWHKEATGIASNEKLSELDSKVVDSTLGGLSIKKSFHADFGTHTSGTFFHLYKGETYKVTARIDSALSSTLYLRLVTGENAETILAYVNIDAGQTTSAERTIVASEDMDVYVWSYHTHPIDAYFNISRINRIENLQERLTNVETEADLIPSLQEDIKYINAHFNGNYEIYETIVASEVKTIGLKVFADRTYNVKANIQNPLDVDVYVEVRDVNNIRLFSIPILAGNTQSQPGDGAVSFNNDQELTLSLYSSKNVSNLHFTLYEVISLDKASNDAYSISRKLYGVDGNPQVRVTESVFDSVADFADVMNQEFSDYAIRSHGSPACMMKLKSTDTWDVIVEKSNHNFRNNVIDLKLPKDINVISINAALEKPIMRFHMPTMREN